MRPVLVGMNNPLSSRPEHALYPAPERVTGWNIWRMLHETCGMSREEYLRVFDRRNVLNSRTWDRKAAREAGYAMWCSLDQRIVAFLGRQVLDAVGAPADVEPLRWCTPQGGIMQEGGPLRWCYIPHPSGLTRWYNEPTNRVAVGLRLEQMAEEWRQNASAA